MKLNTVDSHVRLGDKKEVWKLTLDDGSYLIATPDHKILLKTLEYKALRDLKEGESLSPFNTHISNIRYRQVSNVGAPMQSKNEIKLHRNRRQYRIIFEFFKGFIDPKTYAIHHKDFCSYNDNIDNLEVILHEEHRKIHSERMKGENNPYYRFSYVREIANKNLKSITGSR